MENSKVIELETSKIKDVVRDACNKTELNSGTIHALMDLDNEVTVDIECKYKGNFADIVSISAFDSDNISVLIKHDIDFEKAKSCRVLIFKYPG